jgi:predicted type IV restriction endonuclease
MPAPPKILDLLSIFERNAEHYNSVAYKEAMLRQQFVNPFFECFGWDMENKLGHAPDYQDVIHEASVKIGWATKAPDYSFGIGKDRKFFV